MTSATIHRLGWKIAASTMASSSAGNAIIRSVKRMRIAPTQPRKIAGGDADQRPDRTAMPLATIPMTSEVRAP